MTVNLYDVAPLFLVQAEALRALEAAEAAYVLANEKYNSAEKTLASLRTEVQEMESEVACTLGFMTAEQTRELGTRVLDLLNRERQGREAHRLAESKLANCSRLMHEAGKKLVDAQSQLRAML